MKSRFISVKDIKIHYITYGKGPPLLFFHGHRSDCLRFKKITDRLISKYKIIIPDLPGFGKSECLKKPHDLNNLIPYLEEFVKKIKIKNYILAGVSLGATLALLFIQRNAKGIKKIVLFGPVVDKKFLRFSAGYIFRAKIALKLFKNIPGLTKVVDKIIRSDFLFRKITYFTLPLPLRTKEIIDYEVRQWRQMSMRVWAEVCLSVLNFRLTLDKPIGVSGIFILPELDRYIDVEKTKFMLKSLFPQGEVIVLKQKKHVEPGEISDKTLDELKPIFDKI